MVTTNQELVAQSQVDNLGETVHGLGKVMQSCVLFLLQRQNRLQLWDKAYYSAKTRHITAARMLALLLLK